MVVDPAPLSYDTLMLAARFRLVVVVMFTSLIAAWTSHFTALFLHRMTMRRIRRESEATTRIEKIRKEGNCEQTPN